MKVNRTMVAVSLVALFAMAASTTWAGEKKVNLMPGKGEVEAPAIKAVQEVANAYRLARYGDAHRHVLSLIAAAHILKEAGEQPSGARRQGASSTNKTSGAYQYDVDSILGRARGLANGRADLLGLVDDEQRSGVRGAKAGPHRWEDVVSTGKTDAYQVAFRGGEPAAVAVSGDGDSDLDLYVYDESGNLVCKDEGKADDMMCRWTPHWTGAFIIKIRNLGVANHYIAIHN
jgi:hypothetical protein